MREGCFSLSLSRVAQTPSRWQGTLGGHRSQSSTNGTLRFHELRKNMDKMNRMCGYVECQELSLLASVFLYTASSTCSPHFHTYTCSLARSNTRVAFKLIACHDTLMLERHPKYFSSDMLIDGALKTASCDSVHFAHQELAFMYKVCILSLCSWEVFTAYPGFISHLKNIHVRSIEDCKLWRWVGMLRCLYLHDFFWPECTPRLIQSLLGCGFSLPRMSSGVIENGRMLDVWIVHKATLWIVQ